LLLLQTSCQLSGYWLLAIGKSGAKFVKFVKFTASNLRAVAAAATALVQQ
jgi:hypothetical protein